MISVERFADVVELLDVVDVEDFTRTNPPGVRKPKARFYVIRIDREILHTALRTRPLRPPSCPSLYDHPAKP
jgi:hypothetical protein